MADVRIERATEADIAFVMAAERQEGYEALVGRWGETRHREALGDPRYAYFVARDGGEPVGFALLRDWASPERVTLIKRVAVSKPGLGVGKAMLRAVIDAAFRDTDVHRLCLGVFPENLRAQAAYRAVGFKPEGVSRGSAHFGGAHRDELVMALLRTDVRPGPP